MNFLERVSLLKVESLKRKILEEDGGGEEKA
jgi:hypothetical protein